MRISLLFLILAVAKCAIVAALPSTFKLRSSEYTNKTECVSDYLGKLTPVAKDVLVHGIAGLAVGADVNSLVSTICLLPSTLMQF